MDWAGFLKSESSPAEKRDGLVGWAEALATIQRQKQGSEGPAAADQRDSGRETKEAKESFLSRVSKAKLLVRSSRPDPQRRLSDRASVTHTHTHAHLQLEQLDAEVEVVRLRRLEQEVRRRGDAVPAVAHQRVLSAATGG